MSSTLFNPTDGIWDVVIVGAGPAGSATATTLAGLGRRVLLLDERTTTRFKLGESLPPSSIGIVKHFLGDIDNPACCFPGLFKTAGNVSVWTSDQANVTDFFFTSAGFGLCVDRLAFDEALRQRAVAAGAVFLEGVRFESGVRATTDPELNWQLTLRRETQTMQVCTRYLVDCTGRRAAVAKVLGVPVVVDDDALFAYAQWFSCTGVDDEHYTRIEAAPDGWWYSNRLPAANGEKPMRLVVFHTDKDLPAAKMAARPEGFDALLNESVHVGPLLKEKGYAPGGMIRGAPANSQRLHEFCGDAWMAVGDAAQAYDPLSSQGIDKALRTGSHAGHMVHYALTDSAERAADLDRNNAYIRQYGEQQQQLWQTYVLQRQHYYGMQPRWSDQPFWQRRRA